MNRLIYTLRPGHRCRRLDAATHALPLCYAVMTPDSGFPAGWVRFDASHRGYLFVPLMPGHGAPVTPVAQPQDAVPGWVGVHRLRKIHPIPEDLTADMMAAAPEMLSLLRQLRGILHAAVSPVDLVRLDLVIAKAEGRD